MEIFPKTSIVQIYIQATAGSKIRSQVNETTLAPIRIDTLSVPHPYAYGFILNTQGNDGDCLDCFIITNTPMAANTCITANIIGHIPFYENGIADLKYIAVLPDTNIKYSSSIHENISVFLDTIFKKYPDIQITIADFVPYK